MATILAAGNVILCLVVAFLQFLILKLNKNIIEKEHKRIKILIAFMSIFWAIIYIYVVLVDLSVLKGLNEKFLGQVIIRPANFFFLWVISSIRVGNLS